MSQPFIKFNNEKHAAFAKELKQRVNLYFKEKGISKHANTAMIIKTISMLAMFIVPYTLLMSGVITSIWLHYLMWMIMGLGVAGIGMSVMHDANHGAYSKRKWVNRLLGRLIDVVGGNASNWKIQHNLLHHTFTNLQGLDQDIDSGAVLRLSPDQKLRKFHKYQHIYAWFLYGLMTMQWMTVKDFTQMIEFRKRNIDKNRSRKFWKEYTIMVMIKLFYYSYIIVLPIIFLPFAWWQVVLGVLLMHFTTGFTLATTFQLAHVMPSTNIKSTIIDQTMQENWVVHQLETTTDFARNNKLISWYIGGLNFQVEHHLFPNICHIHYKKIAEIVEKTAKEYGVAYYNIPSFRKAIAEHAKMLKMLGSDMVGA